MCFIAVLRLVKPINVEVFAKILKDLGYTVEVREIEGEKVVEAKKNSAKLLSRITKDKVRVETNDYGADCLKDLDEIYKALYEEDIRPEVIEVVSPYIYAYEKRKHKAKRLLKEIDVEAEEVYSGYCG